MKAALPLLACAMLLIYPHLMWRSSGFDIVSTNREEHHVKLFNGDFHGRAATYWNPLARVDLSKEGASNRYPFISGLSKRFRDTPLLGRYILVDGGAATRQFRIGPAKEQQEVLRHFVFSIPYRLTGRLDDVLLIGPGGGLEVLVATHFKVKHVDAVDLNPDIIAILTGRNTGDELRTFYAHLTGGTDDTTVNYILEEGRSRLSKTRGQAYDVVELTGVDVLSALLSGGMVLSDNYLYTREALGYYYDALKPEGYAQICYWSGPYGLRLFATAMEMLIGRGVDQPARSLIVVTDGDAFANVIIKRGVFSAQEIAQLRAIVAEDQFELLFAPDMDVGRWRFPTASEAIGPAHYVFYTHADTREALLKQLPYNVRPTTDPENAANGCTLTGSSIGISDDDSV